MKSIAWDIWLYCNYDCKFCNSKVNIIPKELKTFKDVINVWKKVYEKYGRCKLHITGGEPFLYPNFIEIILSLLEYHNLHVTTNLSFNVDKLKVLNIKKDYLFINATFHPFYQKIQEFISKVSILKDSGYEVSATYMSDDLQMLEFLNYKNIFLKNNISFSPVEVNCKKVKNNIVKDFLINGFIKKRDISIKAEGNNLCNAGYSYLVVKSSGDIFVCSRNENKIGNIFIDGLDFLLQKNNCSKDCILSEKKYY